MTTRKYEYAIGQYDTSGLGNTLTLEIFDSDKLYYNSFNGLSEILYNVGIDGWHYCGKINKQLIFMKLED